MNYGYKEHVACALEHSTETLKQACETARKTIQLMRSFRKEHRELWTEADMEDLAEQRTMLTAYENVLEARGIKTRAEHDEK